MREIRRVTFLCSILVATLVVGSSTSGQSVSSTRNVKQTSAAAPPVQGAPYFALIIGNNNYKHLQKLATAINDAKDVERLLREKYGFQTKLLLDADRNQITGALYEYRRALPEDSNFLIYYAGHGHHDYDADEAYWLPIDAVLDDNTNWVSADDITRDVRAMASRHILIISDSCYSGYLTRDAGAGASSLDRAAYLRKVVSLKSRTLLSSGGDEPVADDGAPGHSVFAHAFLESLGSMDEDVFSAAYLFENFLKPRVGGQSNQLPHYSEVRNSGDNLGDFVFSRQPAAPATAVTSSAASGSAASLTNIVQPTRGPILPIWAVGDKGFIAHSEDGGFTWQKQASGTNKSLYSVSFVNSQLGWAVGDPTVVVHTEDGGRTWVLQETGVHADITTLHAVTFVSPKSGWAVGYPDLLLHTDDGGRSWRNQFNDHTPYYPAEFGAVTFITPQSGWVVGHKGIILHTEDAGRIWTRQTSGTNADLDSVVFNTPKSGWVKGYDAPLLHTEDGGLTWHEKDVGSRHGLLGDVFFDTAKSGWILLGGEEAGAMLHTDDGGITWQKRKTGVHDLLGFLLFTSPLSGVVGGKYGTILTTKDGGLTWQKQESGTDEEWIYAGAFAKP